jgi:hypothetical protein
MAYIRRQTKSSIEIVSKCLQLKVFFYAVKISPRLRLLSVIRVKLKQDDCFHLEVSFHGSASVTEAVQKAVTDSKTDVNLQRTYVSQTAQPIASTGDLKVVGNMKFDLWETDTNSVKRKSYMSRPEEIVCCGCGETRLKKAIAGTRVM